MPLRCGLACLPDLAMWVCWEAGFAGKPSSFFSAWQSQECIHRIHSLPNPFPLQPIWLGFKEIFMTRQNDQHPVAPRGEIVVSRISSKCQNKTPKKSSKSSNIHKMSLLKQHQKKKHEKHHPKKQKQAKWHFHSTPPPPKSPWWQRHSAATAETWVPAAASLGEVLAVAVSHPRWHPALWWEKR